MNTNLEPFAPVLKVLERFPLTFQPAWVEQNSQGQDILVFSCKELPLRDFIYIPGEKDVALGWDTKRCPLPSKIRDAFHQYYLDSLDYYREDHDDEVEYYQELLADPALTEEKRRELLDELDELEEDIRKKLSLTWEEYLQKLLADLDACTSPLRTADISPMLAERWAWNTPETIEPPFAMPTEDEWEYLCSGGVHSLFPWGDFLDLYAIDSETLDKDAKNAFGLIIGNDCRAERVADSLCRLKGDDGCCALCGGEGDRAAFPYSPYYQACYQAWTTDEDLEKEMAKYWRRRILRLAPPGESLL